MVAIALVGVFAAISISVVHSKHPLDGALETSFDSSVSKLTTRRVAADPLGCRKAPASAYYYECTAQLSIRGRPGFLTVVYRVRLKGDGCWTTPIKPPVALPPRFRTPSGCIGD